MRRKSLADMACPMARSLDVVGEWWTLLIVRDALVGARRFEDFRQTGIADNILSARLDRLVAEGIFARRAYQDRPPRYEYLLTEKGRDLTPVVYALAEWGLKWTDGSGTEGPRGRTRFLHARCDSDVTASFFCPTCGEAVPTGEVHLQRGQSAAELGSPAGESAYNPMLASD